MGRSVRRDAVGRECDGDGDGDRRTDLIRAASRGLARRLRDGAIRRETARERRLLRLATAKLFDASLLAAERSGDVAAIDALERRAEIARDAFWMPDGLSYNKYWHTIDRFVAPFPELNYAAYATAGRDAAVAAALGRLETSVENATNALHV